MLQRVKFPLFLLLGSLLVLVVVDMVCLGVLAVLGSNAVPVFYALLVICLVAMVVGLVGMAIISGYDKDTRSARLLVVWSLAAFLLILTFIGMFSIGICVLPFAVLATGVALDSTFKRVGFKA